MMEKFLSALCWVFETLHQVFFVAPVISMYRHECAFGEEYDVWQAVGDFIAEGSVDPEVQKRLDECESCRHLFDTLCAIARGEPYAYQNWGSIFPY